MLYLDDIKVEFNSQGFNNKIKVVKRIAYGYRNEDYFFKLIRFLSIPLFHLHENP